MIITFAFFCEEQYIEKKSKFIASGFPVESESQAIEFLDNRRKLHKGARHHVYAYRFENEYERYSDDGEPAGTGGLPVLHLLRKEKIQNAIIIVTRYFGGILLGAGGLTRAYSHSAKLLLKSQNLITKKICQKILLDIEYTFLGKTQYLIQNSDVLILNIEYMDRVKFYLIMPYETVECFLKEAKEISSGTEKSKLLEKTAHVYPFHN